MRGRLGSATACWIVLVAAACDTDTYVASYAVRDSAGIRIVEYGGSPTATHAIALSAEPAWSHGTGEGHYTFSQIQLGALLPGGAAVVYDAMAGEVVRVEPDGRFGGVLAPRGQGPGEVGAVVSIEVPGADTVFVQDMRNRQLLWFADGGLARSVSLASDPTIAFGLRTVGFDADGTLLMTTASYRSEFDVEWLPGWLVRLDPGTAAPDTVGRYDMAARRPPEGQENPFAPFGQVVGFVGGFAHTRSDVPEVVWRDARGATRRILRWMPEPSYPTQTDLERAMGRMREDLVRMNPRMPPERVQEFLDQQVARYRLHPDVPLPLFSWMLGDDSGGVWLGTYAPGAGLDGIGSYSVISAEGEWVGRVIMPTRFRVLDVADDRVLGILTDELEVQSVAVFTLTREPLG